jgi:hypothetical protein
VCKSHVRRISCEPADRNVGVFEVLGLDFCGPMGAPSLGGRWYSLCAVDFRCRFMLHDAVRSNDEAPASFLCVLTTMRSNAMMMKRTPSRAPCVAKSRIHLRGSRRYGSRCNIAGRWKMNGACIRWGLHVRGVILDPPPHQSNAYPAQGTISVQRELREMDGLRKIPQLLSQLAARLFKSMCGTSKR